MDEEWKNIKLPSFQTLSPRVHPPRTTNFGATHIEHSLSRPIGAASAGRYGSLVPPPGTMLTLNTAHDLHFLRNNDPLVQNPLVSHICPHHSLPVDFNSNGKKRHNEIDISNSDTRHKRMIKNRDAAARSRARKQAYTDELELEVAYLLEENARLRKQQKKLCLIAAQQPEKRNFCRANSAPL